MNSFGTEFVHLGNVGIDLSLMPKAPYVDNLAFHGEVCFGTYARCAPCLLGCKHSTDASAKSCQKALYFRVLVRISTRWSL